MTLGGGIYTIKIPQDDTRAVEPICAPVGRSWANKPQRLQRRSVWENAHQRAAGNLMTRERASGVTPVTVIVYGEGVPPRYLLHHLVMSRQHNISVVRFSLLAGKAALYGRHDNQLETRGGWAQRGPLGGRGWTSAWLQ